MEKQIPLLTDHDKSTVLFLTQDFRFKRKTYCQFFHLAFLPFLMKKAGVIRGTSTTYYIVPGYRYALNEKWSVSMEYYRPTRRNFRSSFSIRL